MQLPLQIAQDMKPTNKREKQLSVNLDSHSLIKMDKRWGREIEK